MARESVIAHWDGRQLQVVQEFRTRFVNGIAAVSPKDIWAVGSKTGDKDNPLIMRWNGRRWQVVPTPLLRSEARLSGVAALSRNNVWAVGHVGNRPLAMHWDGRRWRVIGIRREGSLYEVDGSSPGNVWAVGAQGLTGLSINEVSGLVMRWDGRRWKEVEAVGRNDGDLGYEASNDFTGIDAVSPVEAWATHTGVVSGDVQRWNGRRWTVVRSFPAKSILEDIVAVSGTDVWAVGPTSWGEKRPLIVHWNGRSWRVQKTPFAALRAGLSSLSVLSPKDIWAAGDHLIARYSC